MGLEQKESQSDPMSSETVERLLAKYSLPAMVFGVGGTHRGRSVRGDVAASGPAGNAAVGFLTVLEKNPSRKKRRIFSF